MDKTAQNIHLLSRGKDALAVFSGWEETLIWSCLQNVMGHIYAPQKTNVTSAMAVIGDFCFFAGEPDANLVSFKPESFKRSFIIMVPQNAQWASLIEEKYRDKAEKKTRYAIKKEPDCFDAEKLKSIFSSLDPQYELKQIDRRRFAECREIPWAQDFVSQYSTYEAYERMGLGVVVEHDGEIVAGASSYTSFKCGIEIEIDTREDHRGKGLASAAGAKLVSLCLSKGWYPSWDAANSISVTLAEKLGYHVSHAYSVYHITGY